MVCPSQHPSSAVPPYSRSTAPRLPPRAHPSPCSSIKGRGWGWRGLGSPRVRAGLSDAGRQLVVSLRAVAAREPHTNRTGPAREPHAAIHAGCRVRAVRGKVSMLSVLLPSQPMAGVAPCGALPFTTAPHRPATGYSAQPQRPARAECRLLGEHCVSAGTRTSLAGRAGLYLDLIVLIMTTENDTNKC